MKELSKKANTCIVIIALGIVFIIIGITLVASKGYGNAQRSYAVLNARAWLDEEKAKELRNEGDYTSARIYEASAKIQREVAEKNHNTIVVRGVLCAVLCISGVVIIIVSSIIIKKEKTLLKN